jgi:hypothetical protein
MNERIRLLAEQAGATVITTHGMEYVVDGCYVIGPARLEQFAELIVRQCQDFVGDKGSMAVKEMIEHFGVEE